MLLTQLRNGDRIQTHPATDAWMQGDRYGEIIDQTSTRVLVRLDSGRRQWFARKDVM